MINKGLELHLLQTIYVYETIKYNINISKMVNV